MQTLFLFLSLLINILWLAVLVQVLLSWFVQGRTNGFILMLNQLTDPILVPLRRVVPSLGMFDITPMIALFALAILNQVLPNHIWLWGG